MGVCKMGIDRVDAKASTNTVGNSTEQYNSRTTITELEFSKQPMRICTCVQIAINATVYDKDMSIAGTRPVSGIPTSTFWTSEITDNGVKLTEEDKYTMSYIFNRTTYKWVWDSITHTSGSYSDKIDDYNETKTFELKMGQSYSRTVKGKNYRYKAIENPIATRNTVAQDQKFRDSVSYFSYFFAFSIPIFKTQDECVLYVNGIIDDSTAINKDKYYDPDADENDENDNDTDSSKYDTTPFNTPQVTPMMISGANNYYCVNVANVNAFVQWLWDDLIKEGTLSQWLLDSITKISGNLYSCITGLKLFPCNIKKHLATVANTPLVLGRFSGGFEVIDATSYNCKIGSIEYKIPSGYNNFLDYQPYTTGVLYLPFVGFSQLDMTIFQPEKTMKIDCFVDITTGVIDYAVSLKNDKEGYSLIETHTGTCGINIPLSYEDASNWLQNFVGDSIKGGVNTIMSKGATSLGQVASDASGSLLDSFDTPTSYNVGSPSPCNGLFMPFEPHIVIRRPKYSRPSTYSKNVGYPCMKSYAPKDLSGFTIFQNPQITFGHTKNSEGQKVLPTKEEMDLLYQLMTEGVYL